MKKLILYAFLFSLTACSCSFPPGGRQKAPATITSPTRAVYPTPSFPTCKPASLSPLQESLPVYPTSTPAGQTEIPHPSLRSLVDERHLYVGASVSQDLQATPEDAHLLATEFNMVMPVTGMNWSSVHPEPGRYDFTQGDEVVAFARANHMAVYGHALVDEALPEWVTKGTYSRQEWINILCTHIKTVATHYQGQIYAWNVVNEAFKEDGTFRETLWLQAIGPEYIAMAFQWAHEADPEAILVLNDHLGDGLDGESQAVFAVAQGLLQQGVPLDGVGMKMHTGLGAPPAPQALASNMQRLAELGLKAFITEMDVHTQASPESEAGKPDHQAEVYRGVFMTCLQAPNCNVFVTWGLTDREAGSSEDTGKTDAPLLFDTNGRPKPAYDAIMNLLITP